MALKYVSRIYFQGKVCAYFKKNKHVLRYKLIKIDEEYVTPKKFRVKESYPYQDPNIVNAQIDELEERIDKAIAAILYLNTDSVINVKVIDDFFEEQKKSTVVSIAADRNLLNDFREYNKQKAEEKHKEDIENGETRKMHPTMKDYISAANAIEDFEYDTKEQLYLSDITEDLVSDFCEWLAEEHVNTAEHKYRCKGDMCNKTINKRLENLSAFIKAYYKEETIANMIMDSRLNDDTPRRVIALELDEVRDLYYRELKNPSYNIVRDYFVFLCLTGLRFLDLTLLSEINFLRQRNGVYKLSYISHKTKVPAEFDLTSKAQEIAIKYNFQFRSYTNQGFNRALGEMLESEDLFNDEASVIRSVLKSKTQHKILRREKVTAHTARRTFISCLIAQGVPPYQVMSMAGHKRFSTMEIYVQKFSPQMAGATKKLEF